MPPLQWITEILLALAIALTWVCAIGQYFMRDAYQRLHFPSPVSSISATCMLIAIIASNHEPSVRLKAILTVLLLFLTNGVLTHATAHAIRIREVGRLEIWPGDQIPYYDGKGVVARAPPREKSA